MQAKSLEQGNVQQAHHCQHAQGPNSGVKAMSKKSTAECMQRLVSLSSSEGI